MGLQAEGVGLQWVSVCLLRSDRYSESIHSKTRRVATVAAEPGDVGVGGQRCVQQVPPAVSSHG